MIFNSYSEQMDTHRLILYLEHVEAEATFMLETAAPLNYAAYVQNEVLTRAFERAIATIGEAINKVQPDLEDPYPALPWGKIVGMRNWLVHQYWEIDHQIVWDVVQHHLPALRTEVRRILADLRAPSS